MSFENKYRVHEVAKDFGRQTKEITQILTDYATTPKNHMQVLDDDELSIIFEYLTQHNQVEDLQIVFANAPAAQEPAPKAEAAPAKPKEKAKDKGEKKNRPAAKSAEQPKPAQPKEKPAPQPQAQRPKTEEQGKAANTRVPAKKLVDTRKAGNVNLDRYDERLENLAPERANRMQSGKQKIQSGKQRRGGSFGSKRKQEEQEKMRRLQLEIAKKTPLTVKIPDEIGVGELASG